MAPVLFNTIPYVSVTMHTRQSRDWYANVYSLSFRLTTLLLWCRLIMSATLGLCVSVIDRSVACASSNLATNCWHLWMFPCNICTSIHCLYSAKSTANTTKRSSLSQLVHGRDNCSVQSPLPVRELVMLEWRLDAAMFGDNVTNHKWPLSGKWQSYNISTVWLNFVQLAETDAKEILTASLLQNWRRPPECTRTMWMKTIKQDLKSNNLCLNEANDVTQNWPLWRLMSTIGAMHS